MGKSIRANLTWENLSEDLILAAVSHAANVRKMLQQHSDKSRERERLLFLADPDRPSRKGQSLNLNCFLASKILANMARMNAG